MGQMWIREKGDTTPSHFGIDRDRVGSSPGPSLKSDEQGTPPAMCLATPPRLAAEDSVPRRVAVVIDKKSSTCC